ncbi:MAG: hypothetical protein ACRDVM_00920 [Acidimicrobiia bacterium]
MRPRSPALGLPGNAREAALFVAVAAVSADALAWGVQLALGVPRATDLWALSKGLLLVAGVGFVALVARSPAMGIFALVFGLVALEDWLVLHAQMGRRLATVPALADLAHRLGVSDNAWGQFLSLLLLSAVGGVAAVWATFRMVNVRRRVGLSLLLLLLGLFLFAGPVDLYSDMYGALATVEEVGETLALSAAVGYSSGLVVMTGLGFRLRDEREEGRLKRRER